MGLYIYSLDHWSGDLFQVEWRQWMTREVAPEPKIPRTPMILRLARVMINCTCAGSHVWMRTCEHESLSFLSRDCSQVENEMYVDAGWSTINRNRGFQSLELLSSTLILRRKYRAATSRFNPPGLLFTLQSLLSSYLLMPIRRMTEGKNCTNATRAT